MMRALTATQKRKLEAVPVSLLKTWSRALKVMDGMEEIFGECPEDEDEKISWWGFLRGEVVAMTSKVSVKGLESGKMMEAVWQGKATVSLEETAKKPELVFKTPTNEYRTGTGPILQLEENVKPAAQRVSYMFSAFTSNTKDGIVPMVSDKYVSKIKDVGIGEVSKLMSTVSKQHVSMGYVTEPVSGVAWATELGEVVSTFDKETLTNLNTAVAVKVLKAATYDSKMAKQEITAVSQDVLSPKAFVAITQQVEVVQPKKKGKKVEVEMVAAKRLVWLDRYNVKFDLNPVVNPHKGDHVFAQQASWAEEVIAMLGGSNIRRLSASAMLSPGLSPHESAIIRFVSVALRHVPEGDGEVLRLRASYSQLLLFFHSFKHYLKTMNDGLTDTEITTLIKLKVCFDMEGLSAVAIRTLKKLYGGDPEKETMLVAWMPRSFTSAGKAKDTVEASEEEYQDLDWKKDYAIYREVLLLPEEGRLFLDGYPNLFNVWHASRPVTALTKEPKGVYGAEPLKEIAKGGFFAMMLTAAKQQLGDPFSPSVVRSRRVLVVVGDKSLRFVDNPDSDDIIEVGQGYTSLEVQISDDEDDDDDDEEDEKDSQDTPPNGNESDEDQDEEEEPKQKQEEAPEEKSLTKKKKGPPIAPKKENVIDGKKKKKAEHAPQVAASGQVKAKATLGEVVEAEEEDIFG